MVNEPTTSTAPQAFSAFWPATSISTVASPVQLTPNLWVSSTFGMADDQAVGGSSFSTPRNTFSFGPSPSSTDKQNGSSNPQPPPLFGRLSSASPVPRSTLSFGQIPAPSTTQPRFSFGSVNPASPAPQSPFNLFGTPGFHSANFSANGTTQAANLATKSGNEATVANAVPTAAPTQAPPASPAGEDGKHELKLDNQEPEVVEALLIYLYTYDFPKFATAGDASVALHLGNLYSIAKFAEKARSQILESVKNFGHMGNEDITSWVQNFELWWSSHQTAMEDIKTEALKLIFEKAEQFTWSDDFVDLLGRNKDIRIDVFKTMAAHKTGNAVGHEADDIAEQIRVSNSQLRERLGEQFKSKVKELNSIIKEKQNELDAALAEKDTLQKRLESAEGIGKQTGSQSTVQPSIFANGGSLFGVLRQPSEAGASSLFGTYSITSKFS